MAVTVRSSEKVKIKHRPFERAYTHVEYSPKIDNQP